MNILKIQIERNGKIDSSKQMAYNDEKEFFTALVTLCDELGVDVPLWTVQEEKVLVKKGSLVMDMDNGEVLRIFSYSE